MLVAALYGHYNCNPEPMSAPYTEPSFNTLVLARVNGTIGQHILRWKPSQQLKYSYYVGGSSLNTDLQLWQRSVINQSSWHWRMAVKQFFNFFTVIYPNINNYARFIQLNQPRWSGTTAPSVLLNNKLTTELSPLADFTSLTITASNLLKRVVFIYSSLSVTSPNSLLDQCWYICKNDAGTTIISYRQLGIRSLIGITITLTGLSISTGMVLHFWFQFNSTTGQEKSLIVYRKVTVTAI